MPIVLEEMGVKSRFSLPPITREQFKEFCLRNPNLRAERTAEGELIIMPPTFSKTGIYSLRIGRQFDEYTERTGNGYAFDSSTGFTLPDGSQKSPDASWIQTARWDALSEEEQNDFADICPDVVVELMSFSDHLSEAQKKMEQYRINGAPLGLLIDRKKSRVYVYRPGQPVQTLIGPAEVSGEPEMPGFVLKMARIFDGKK